MPFTIPFIHFMPRTTLLRPTKLATLFSILSLINFRIFHQGLILDDPKSALVPWGFISESYVKQAHKKRKEVVLEHGDDPEHLRTNVFQEGGNDENHETGQIQAKCPSGEGWRPWGRDTIKTINCCWRPKLIWRPKLNMFLVIIFIYCSFGPTYLEDPCLFLSFCSDTL